MRRALSGESGTVVGLDYRGVSVLAAHEPVAVLNLGIVAKIDLTEVRAPFARAGIIVFGIAVVIILAGTIVFFRVSDPIARDLWEGEERFRGMFERTEVPMTLGRTDGHIRMVNAAFCKMFGYSEEELVGLSFWTLTHPGDLEDSRKRHGRLVAGEIDLIQAEKRYVRKDGQLIWGHVSVSVVRDTRGKVLYTVGQYQDITGRKQAEEALRESEAAMINAQRIAQLGSWDWDIVTNEIKRSDEALRIYGLEPQEVHFSHAAFMNSIHPDDRPRIQEITDRLLDEGSSDEAEYRFIRHTGEEHIIHEIAEITRDVSGKAVRMRGTIQDITDRKRAEEALRESEERLRAIIDNLPILIYLRDKEGRYILTNKEFDKRHGIEPGSGTGKTPYDLVSRDIADGFLADDQKVLEGGPVISVEFEEIYGDGVTRTVLSNKFPVVGLDGKPVAVGAASTDITARKRAEVALRKSEKSKAVILSASQDSIILFDLDGVILEANEAAAKRFGKSVKEFIGQNIFKLMPPNLAKQRLANWEKLIQSRRPIVTMDHREGVWFENTIHPLFDDCGNVDRAVVFARDITERKQAEEALRESEARFKSVTDNSPSPIYLKDTEGRYLFVNKEFERRRGITIAEALGKTAYDFFPKEIADAYTAHEREVTETGSAVQKETTAVRPGLIGHNLTVKFPVLNDKGDVVGIGAISTDITERKRVEEALRESEARLRSIIDNSPNTISLRDRDGRFLLVNKAIGRLYGAEPDEIIGKTSHEIFSKEIVDTFLAEDKEVLRTGGTLSMERAVTYPTGETRWVIMTKFPLFGVGGDPMGVCVIGTDITDHKKAEEALRESEAWFRAVIDSAPAIIHLKDTEGRFLVFNRAAEDFHGTTAEEALGKTAYDIFPKEDADTYTRLDRSVLETGTVQDKELDLTIKNDIRRIVRSIRFPIPGSDGEIVGVGVGVVAEEVTETKMMERALRDSEERFRRIFEDTGVASALGELDGPMHLVNSAMCKMFGYSEPELLAMSLLNITHPDDRDGSIRRRSRMLAGNAKPYHVEKRYIRKYGETIWAFCSFAPVHDAEGKLLYIVRQFQDITERKKAENELETHRRHLEDLVDERTHELSQAKELAETANRTKSEFLANMSHELRTPLNAILGFSNAMQEQIFGPVENEKYEEYINDIHQSGEHLLELINDILDLSKIEAMALDLDEDPVDLGKVSEAIMRLIRPRVEGGGVSVTNKVDGNLPHLFGDERRVKQILFNLLSNATKFTEAGGEVVLDAHVNTDGGLALVVSDTGIGMDESELETAFSAFGQVDGTLARKHVGTGLGLPLTRALIELHGGTIVIESKIGEGTKVTVEFPPERTLRDG